jgi:hypothetical protein
MGVFSIGGGSKASQSTTNQQIGIQGTNNLGVSTGRESITALGGFAGRVSGSSTVNIYSMDVAALEANQAIAEAAIVAGQRNTEQSLEIVRQLGESGNAAVLGIAELSGNIAALQTPAGFSEVLASQSTVDSKQMVFALIVLGAVIGLTLYLRK